MQLGEPTGVTANIVAECLGHMKCWVRLALGVAKAEFPDFAVLNAFSCLRLPTSNQGARAAPNHDTLSHLIESKEGANTESKLHALADLFELPRDEVVAQVMDVKSLAAAIKENGEATGDKQAYDLAIAKYSRRHNRELHPTASAVEVLIRWFGWVIVSSGVEQCFTHLQRVFSAGQRGSLSRQREQDILTLLSDVEAGEEEELITIAQEFNSIQYIQVLF